jgi:hypothetical protein
MTEILTAGSIHRTANGLEVKIIGDSVGGIVRGELTDSRGTTWLCEWYAHNGACRGTVWHAHNGATQSTPWWGECMRGELDIELGLFQQTAPATVGVVCESESDAVFMASDSGGLDLNPDIILDALENICRDPARRARLLALLTDLWGAAVPFQAFPVRSASDTRQSIGPGEEE